jgi:hypothetical protein
MINVFAGAIVPACSPIHQEQAPMIYKNDSWKKVCKNWLKQKTRLFTGGFFHAVGFG